MQRSFLRQEDKKIRSTGQIAQDEEDDDETDSDDDQIIEVA